MSQSMKQLLEELKIGGEYTFGEPWKLGDRSLSAVVPILRKNPRVRDYVLLPEVEGEVDMEDTGHIGGVRIRNRSGKNVFIRQGTLLKGQTQARTVTAGMVIVPSAEKVIDVQCVHASMGIRTGARFQYGGTAPRRVEKALLRRGNQSETWYAVSRDIGTLNVLSACGPVTLSDDLVGTLQQVQRFREDVEETLKKIPADLPGQVGVAILDITGVHGVEVFDHPDSWRAFSKSVIRNYTDILTKEGASSLYEIKTAYVALAIIEFLEKLREAKETVVSEAPVSKTYSLDGEGVVGEYTVLNGWVIHIVGSRREEEKEKPQPHVPPHVHPPVRGGLERQRRPSTSAAAVESWVAVATATKQWEDKYRSPFDQKMKPKWG